MHVPNVHFSGALTQSHKPSIETVFTGDKEVKTESASAYFRASSDKCLSENKNIWCKKIGISNRKYT